jgi:hypothetical protein
MLCYNIPAVDLNGTARTFVVSYPQIGSFASATPAERKYFESFHNDMLENYRPRRPKWQPKIIANLHDLERQ